MSRAPAAAAVSTILIGRRRGRRISGDLDRAHLEPGKAGSTSKTLSRRLTRTKAGPFASNPTVSSSFRPSSGKERLMMTPTRRTLLKGAGGAMIALAIFPTSSALAAWSGGGQLPMKKDYFDGTAVDHGVEYRRTNMALIPREYRPQITREIVDPEPGRLVIDSREHSCTSREPTGWRSPPIPSSRTAPARSACAGSRSCPPRSRRAWHPLASARSGSR